MAPLAPDALFKRNGIQVWPNNQIKILIVQCSNLGTNVYEIEQLRHGCGNLRMIDALASAQRRFTSSIESPPGPKGLPLLGNALAFRRDPLSFLTECAHRYGDVVAVRLGSQKTILLSNPADIDRVFVGDHQNFLKARFFWRQVTAVFGTGLLTSEGSFWQHQRRLAAPAFAGPKLLSYADTIVRLGEQMVDAWQLGEVRDLHVDMMGLTLKIAAKTLFGTDLEDDITTIEAAVADMTAEIASRLTRPILIPDALPLPGHIRYRRGVRRVEGVVERIIGEHRREPHGDDDLLSAMINARDEAGASMSDRQLRDEAVTFLLAGHETTALALTWTLYLLGRHPDVGAQLATDVRRVLGNRSATIDDLSCLQLAEHVISESMRLYPPAWSISRETARDCEIGGYRVGAGTVLFIVPWVLHRDARFFDDPDVFRPERWRDGLAKRLPRCVYMPFGGGPRICIAHRFAMMEAVLVLVTIFQRVRLVPQPRRPVVPLPSITLRPEGDVLARVEARSG